MKTKICFPGLVCHFRKLLQISKSTGADTDDIRQKPYIIGLLVLWFLIFFFTVICCKAQDVKPLQVGDRIPDITMDHVSNFPASSLKLSDFKGKLVILDFWATWCSPCIAMIPKMDSLQKAFEGRIQFLPVAYQSEKEITTFLQKLEKQEGRHFNLPDVTGDKILVKLFPHYYLPHFVWIDENGTVVAITEMSEVTKGNIERMLKDPSTRLAEKNDEKSIAYNAQLPLLIDNNGQSQGALQYHSILTSYIEGLPPGFNRSAVDSVTGFKMTFRNVPLTWLFRTAYGEGKAFFGANRMRVLVKDTSRINNSETGQAYLSWLRSGNGFCYELLVPSRLSGGAYKIMQHEFSILFPQYLVRVEKQPMECLALVRTTANENFKSAGGPYEMRFDATGCQLKNVTLNNLIVRLNQLYMQDSPYPVLDETGYNQPVDLDLQANLSDMDSVNEALLKYGLHFNLVKRSIDVLTIRDSPLKTRPNHFQ